MIFQHLTIPQIFLRFDGKVKVPSSQNLKSENFKRLENEVICRDFSTQIDNLL